MDRMPSIPLITHDPYFSIWSADDKLNSSATVHWTGKQKPMNGYIKVDGSLSRFMGANDAVPAIEQTDLRVLATSSKYTFTSDKVILTVRFTSPLLLEDLSLVSRPATYIDFEVRSADGAEHEVEIYFDMSAELSYNGGAPELYGDSFSDGKGRFAWLGKNHQALLSHSGDWTTIDWGYLWLYSANEGCVCYSRADYLGADDCAKAAKSDGQNVCLCAKLDLGKVGNASVSDYLIAAYDDVLSIQYFNRPTVAYWAKDGMTIAQAIKNAAAEHDDLIIRCDAFDIKNYAISREAGGEGYAKITSTAYRQTIAAHKLIADENGDVVFLSKENDSNGCIGTVDVSYPSTPLYLLYNPELVLGMLRPVFKFAKLPAWKFDYAPHDVGRYPYATGQVYGLAPAGGDLFYPTPDSVVPHFYNYSCEKDLYDHRYQMPIEECGNMLVMSAAVAMLSNEIDSIKENMDLLGKWAAYLVKHGMNPDEQLCTDDFAGHLAGNVNLSAKAIMGVASYGLILERLDRADEAQAYLLKAKRMADEWIKRAYSADGSHTVLAYGVDDSWSQKYNTIWDLVFNTELFPAEFFSSEVKSYLSKLNQYGLPLDSRKSYTKSDWTIWSASMADAGEELEVREEIIQGVSNFLSDTPDRFPFSDWYDTITAKHMAFKNRTVQGGVFMPLLVDKFKSSFDNYF